MNCKWKYMDKEIVRWIYREDNSDVSIQNYSDILNLILNQIQCQFPSR